MLQKVIFTEIKKPCGKKFVCSGLLRGAWILGSRWSPHGEKKIPNTRCGDCLHHDHQWRPHHPNHLWFHDDDYDDDDHHHWCADQQEPCCQHTYYRARWLLPTPKIDVNFHQHININIQSTNKQTYKSKYKTPLPAILKIITFCDIQAQTQQLSLYINNRHHSHHFENWWEILCLSFVECICLWESSELPNTIGAAALETIKSSLYADTPENDYLSSLYADTPENDYFSSLYADTPENDFAEDTFWFAWKALQLNVPIGREVKAKNLIEDSKLAKQKPHLNFIGRWLRPICIANQL